MSFFKFPAIKLGPMILEIFIQAPEYGPNAIVAAKTTPPKAMPKIF